MSFWSEYVILKEKDGIERSTSLQKIETKFGLTTRQQVEADLAAYDASLLN